MESTLGPFDVATGLVVLAAFFGYLNHRFFGLPQTTALTIMGAVASIAVIAIDEALPSVNGHHPIRSLIEGIDFRYALMEGMLSFLLFAGALHVDLNALKRSRLAIGIITLFGVLLSTAVIGGGAWLIAMATRFPLPITWCLLFGALISPTDPVAVMGILKSAKVPPDLEATVAGESLFNDGIGIVVFSILLGVVANTGEVSAFDAGKLFALEALGGAAFGGVAGWIAFLALRSINEHNLEVLITLALVMGGYALSHRLHVNGPIAMAVAGLLIGNHGRQHAMSETTRDYVTKFWSLIDDMLNAVLFLLIGIEVILVLKDVSLLLFGLAAVPLILVARAVSVGLPMLALRNLSPLSQGAYPILVLGGVRGGISIALALSVPAGPYKEVVVAATYTAVLFSVLLQAPAVGIAARRLFANPPVKDS
ncbi:sodium:proton antiporter [Thermomonas sp.]|uniref:cation:proton antiporter n=1 Tax=Thermomonas sp. TaxID=1971895 RepID=UPI00248A23D9|nr:sodium:proton antiporter [Thermomonas sp.]MDI1252150.1 sodium:proton antiporter [Thermomonas sp.]